MCRGGEVSRGSGVACVVGDEVPGVASAGAAPRGDSLMHELKRHCAGQAAVGGFFSGLVYPAVYGALDKLWPGTTFRAVATKSVAELIPMGIGANALSIGWRAAVGGSSPSEVSARLQRLMPGVLLNEVRVWLPYNLLAFRFIPINIRPTSTAVVMLGWNVYLSHTSARDIAEP